MRKKLFLTMLCASLLGGLVQSSFACVFGGENVRECLEKCSQSPTEIGVTTCIVGSPNPTASND